MTVKVTIESNKPIKVKVNSKDKNTSLNRLIKDIAEVENDDN